MDKLAKIIAGHEQFKAAVSSELKGRYSELSTGQAPEILFITCSDSRVDPSFATGAEPGELFVIRNAGNIIPIDVEGSSELGTVQYATDVLGVKHIIVCGHSDCGAVKALMNPDSVKALPAIANYLCNCASEKPLDGSKSVIENVQQHTLNQIEALKKLDFVQEKVASGDLSLHGWIFDIESYSFSTCDASGSWTGVCS